MEIQGIQGMDSVTGGRKNHFSSFNKDSESGVLSKRNKKSPELKEENREKLLNRVKSRVKNGYYDSDDVIEDIGHGFADLLNSYMK